MQCGGVNTATSTEASHLTRPTRFPTRLLTATLAVLLAGGPAAATPPADVPRTVDQPGLQRALDRLPDETATAASVRVHDVGARVTARAGVRDLVSGRPVPRDARFRIASATKMFTAVLVLQLAGERRLDLDAPVQRYLPELLPESYRPVPVRTLLDHTSGLPHSTEDADWESAADFVAHCFDFFTPEQVVATATAHPLVFEPGTRQEYNGVNYFVAGRLAERVTGTPYARLLQRRILRPLRLRDTSLPALDE